MNYQKLVKEIRKKLIITQEELAVILGVSFASINRWEKGHHQPTVIAKEKLKQLFKDNGIKMEEKY